MAVKPIYSRQVIKTIDAPAENPPTGFVEIFADADNNKISVLKSDGTMLSLVEEDGTILRTAELYGGTAASEYAPDQIIYGGTA